jgi:RNA polymerase sigma factor (sigma-70 family)
MVGAQNMRHASLHDVELANLSAAGDRGAFGELVRRHGSAVRALVRRMGAGPAESDDVAQDAFLSAFESITDFRGHGAFVGWVKRIAARHYLRRLQRSRLLVNLDDGAVEGEVEGVNVQAFAAGRIDLDGALRALSAVERLCVTMCYGAGLSHSEAAEALNLPLGTVKSHVKRGLEKLRARLAPGSVTEEGSRVHG